MVVPVQHNGRDPQRHGATANWASLQGNGGFGRMRDFERNHFCMKSHGEQQIKGRRCAQHHAHETLLSTMLLSLSGCSSTSPRLEGCSHVCCALLLSMVRLQRGINSTSVTSEGVHPSGGAKLSLMLYVRYGRLGRSRRERSLSCDSFDQRHQVEPFFSCCGGGVPAMTCLTGCWNSWSYCLVFGSSTSHCTGFEMPTYRCTDTTGKKARAGKAMRFDVCRAVHSAGMVPQMGGICQEDSA